MTYRERVLALTDETDPMRDIETVATVSWFHVSRHEEWPPAEAAARDRAIHLGTYEAAIDMMMYRMDWMGDATVPFFLHRVTIDPNAAIDPAIHPDKSGQEWGALDLETVTTDGYTVRRYINANEHHGSLSLAAALDAIVHVQTIAVPVAAHAAAIDPDAAAAEATLVETTAVAQVKHRAAVTAYDAKEPPAPHPDPNMQRVLERLGATERTGIDKARDRIVCAAENTFDAHLRERYLRPGVSAERAEKVSSALGARARQTGESLHDLYRRYAPLMRDPAAVVSALAASEPRRSPVLDP